MTLALADHGLLLSPPDSQTGEAAVKAERERVSAREDLIASCMKSQGFEYWPEAAEYFVAAMDDPEFEPGSRQWVEYYGFEVSTMLFLGVDSLPEGVHGYRGTQAGPGENVVVAELPNQKYIKTLSSEEYDAYHSTYNGYLPDGTFVSGDNCWDRAMEAVPEEVNLSDIDVEGQLRDAVLSDSEWIDYEQRVAACVSEEGFEPNVSNDVLIAHYEKRLKEERVLPPVDINIDEVDDPTRLMLPWESSEWFEALKAVQKEEREHGVAFYDCGGDQATRIDVMTEIIERLAVDGG